MNRITALDWLNANVKSEDLNENRTSLGLNKKAKGIHGNADAVDSVNTIDSFVNVVKHAIVKSLNINPSYVKIHQNMSKIVISFIVDDEEEKVIAIQIATEECEEEEIRGMFGCCAYDEVTGGCRPCRIDFNDFIDLGDEAVAPDDRGLFVMCGEMYPCNTEYLEAMIDKIKNVKEAAEQGDFSAWSWFQPF